MVIEFDYRDDSKARLDVSVKEIPQVFSTVRKPPVYRLEQQTLSEGFKEKASRDLGRTAIGLYLEQGPLGPESLFREPGQL